MANSAQAKKRARQAEDSRQRNASQRSAMRTSVKALDAGDKEQATAAYQAAVPVLDRLARKGLVHKNAAARSKSRLNKAVRAL